MSNVVEEYGRGLSSLIYRRPGAGNALSQNVRAYTIIDTVTRFPAAALIERRSWKRNRLRYKWKCISYAYAIVQFVSARRQHRKRCSRNCGPFWRPKRIFSSAPGGKYYDNILLYISTAVIVIYE